MAVVIVVLLWLLLRSKGRLSMGMLEGEVATLKRGHLTVPIEASGTVEPKDRVDIKSEAGGTVIETPIEVGQLVTMNDLLVMLDPEDEQRLVDIARKVLDQSKINKDKAENLLAQREKTSLPLAQSRLKQISAELKYAEWLYLREKEFAEQNKDSSVDQLLQLETRYNSLVAQAEQASSDVTGAQLNIELARKDVEQADLAVKKAQDDLLDAEKRLKETRILAPFNGMLVQLYQKKGAVIASGSSSFGGGTPLARMADVSELYVSAQVDEAEIGRVRDIAPPAARPGSTSIAGMNPQPADTGAGDSQPADIENTDDFTDLTGTPVRVTVEAFPNDEFIGLIDRIEPEPDRTAGQVVISYVVRIRLLPVEQARELVAQYKHLQKNDNEEVMEPSDIRKLFLGMQAIVEFLAESRDNVLLVPNEAVRIKNGRKGVCVPDLSNAEPGTKRARFQTFRGGLDNGMYTEVIEGLQENDTVYIKLPRNHDFDEVECLE
ncbi:MAG: hypothetical protein HJJLKODD_01249 [Phycisphaerae bacterium]|nr:hypothetical protein [Phycisphaerae bacterium]